MNIVLYHGRSRSALAGAGRAKEDDDVAAQAAADAVENQLGFLVRVDRHGDVLRPAFSTC